LNPKSNLKKKKQNLK